MQHDSRATRRRVLALLGAGLGVGAAGGANVAADATSTAVTIEKKNGEKQLRGERERCAVSRNALDAADVDVGEQIRVRCDEKRGYPSGIYTVVDDRKRDGVVEVSNAGLDRMGWTNKSAGATRSYVPHPVYETRAEADENDEFVEILDDDGEEDRLVACAPHGGWIEHPTDRQSRRVADRLGVTEWSCVGYNSGGGAYDRWHITSTDIDRASFPGLDRIADRGFEHAVSFHGFSKDGVAVGGGACDALKLEIRDAVAAATDGDHDVYVADPDGPYAGTSSENFVNWLTAGGNGVQIEQSSAARDEWAAVADAVADVYESRI